MVSPENTINSLWTQQGICGNICAYTNPCMNAITIDENVPNLTASCYAMSGGCHWEACSFLKGNRETRRGSRRSKGRGDCSGMYLMREE